ncbi:MAG: hypothetical protein ACXVFQ_22195, partial [Solirubrobacteraceae bacterium]
MIDFTIETEIARSPAEVFAYVTGSSTGCIRHRAPTAAPSAAAPNSPDSALDDPPRRLVLR